MLLIYWGIGNWSKHNRYDAVLTKGNLLSNHLENGGRKKQLQQKKSNQNNEIWWEKPHLNFFC